MIIHSGKLPLPGSPVLEFRELTVTDLDALALEASQSDGLNAIGSGIRERKLRRLQAIRSYNGTQVDGSTRAHDVLALMCPKAMALYDEALRRVHEPTDAETEAFFEGLQATEV